MPSGHGTNVFSAKICAEPLHEQTDAITGNARLITEAFTGLSGGGLPPSRAGVVFLDGFIQRQRDDEALHDKLADMAACYLGEALIAEIGGCWMQDSDCGLGIELAPSVIVFPFAKASKHFANGAIDSVLSFFDMSALLAVEHRGRAIPSG